MEKKNNFYWADGLSVVETQLGQSNNQYGHLIYTVILLQIYITSYVRKAWMTSGPNRVFKKETKGWKSGGILCSLRFLPAIFIS